MWCPLLMCGELLQVPILEDVHLEVDKNAPRAKDKLPASEAVKFMDALE